MCCNTANHYGFRRMENHPAACFCGCDDSFPCGPRLITKERKISRLEQHLEDLRDEVKAVEEYIAGLKKKK
ncbi:MAG: hypothetical protein GY874_04585 [Desulfobacteraceae bacterium]|nr:hypothetical protein [Desulfobacteraceae bacterium]